MLFNLVFLLLYLLLLLYNIIIIYIIIHQDINFTLGTRGNSLAKSGRPLAGETSVRSEVSEASDLTLVSPANGRPDFASELPLVPRVASGTQGI